MANKSILRDTDIASITLDEFYTKIEKGEFEHRFKLLKEKKSGKKEEFEILTVLGKGGSGFAFLSLNDKKLVALRMSYDQEDFTGKFESVKEKTGENYRRYFLDILYPSSPVQHLYSGTTRNGQEMAFDKTVYASFWEKADDLLENKLKESFEKKFKWFKEFLKGLSIIHSKERAHFDIKPDNLFIVDNQLKIGDFEFYWKIEDFIHSNDCLYCGTIGYISPELFYDRENISTKIDIFSTGVAFARLFTGEAFREIEWSAEEKRLLKEILKKCESVALFDPSHMAEIEKSLSYSLFYRRLVKEKIETADLPDLEEFVFREILLEMMDPDPVSRPGIDEIIGKLEILEPAGVEGTGERSRKADQTTEAELPASSKSLKGLGLAIGFLVVLTVALFLYYFVFNKETPANPSGSHETKSKEPVTKEIRQVVDKSPATSPDPPKIIEPEISPEEQVTVKQPVTREKKPDKTIEPPRETKPVISPEEQEKLKNQGRYESYLDFATELINDGEYERALDAVARARKIKEDDNLLKLERKIKQLMALDVQKNYQMFYGKAEGCYEQERYTEALVNIEHARKVKDTPQLYSLEQRVRNKLKEREQEYERGLALAEELKNNEEYERAKELVETLKKVKADEHLLQLEREIDRELAQKREEEQSRSLEYTEYLVRAKVYMDNGDFEKAEAEIEKAKLIKTGPELDQVEERLNWLKLKAQQDYAEYYKWAGIYYDNDRLAEAKHQLELAKKIKQTYELTRLERKIDERVQEKAQEDAARKADDDAYFKAIRGGEVWDLQEYIRNNPDGSHVEEAKGKLNKLLNSLVPEVQEPKLVRKVPPVYPQKAMEKRISGIVLIEATIDTRGNVTKTRALKGPHILRVAALRAVKLWKYEPHIVGGVPKPVSFTVKVDFELPEKTDGE
jgi:TonB family protein